MSTESRIDIVGHNGNDGDHYDKKLKELLECKCKDIYTIEEHGDGYALYWGRCNHRHGYNLLHITECSRKDILQMIEDKLNNNG